MDIHFFIGEENSFVTWNLMVLEEKEDISLRKMHRNGPLEPQCTSPHLGPDRMEADIGFDLFSYPSVIFCIEMVHKKL